MVHICVVCNKVGHVNRNLSFHRFPQDPEKKKVWFSLVGILENQPLRKNPELCSEHFFPEDVLVRANGAKYIRKDANPRRCEGFLFLDDLSNSSDSTVFGTPPAARKNIAVSESSLSTDENGYEFSQDNFNESHQFENELQIKEEILEDDQNAYLNEQEFKEQLEQVAPKQSKQIKPQNEQTTEMMDVLNSINEQKKSNNYVDESTTGMVNIMKKFFNEQRNFNKDKDEFDIFGELISRKIRNLNTHYARATVQNMLNNILYEAELGKYDAPLTTNQNDINRRTATRECVNCPSTSTYSNVDTTYSNTKSDSIQHTDDCVENNLN
ncbi:unnamed protein product [Psylliodes chrysocephalus]|uniref:THAP-type domain-containing protein n=1 Tax=Psylliodes chrysocephalus TaxID=3402493 RepID=A0A9P0GJ16_9CUCU|nr:unnamed protein product [Psylliodes chrysocephala]